MVRSCHSDALDIITESLYMNTKNFDGGCEVITAQQLRAARALLGIDQKTLAEMAMISLPTIQRMEASEGNVRGNIDTLSKVVIALETAGVELIGEYSRSQGDGRGVRLRQVPSHVDLERFHP